MSTYLLAFALAPYIEISVSSTQGAGYEMRSLVDETQKNFGYYAMDAGLNMTDFFGEYLAYFYSKDGVSKQDQILIPRFASGAMENWGLVTYKQDTMFYNKSHHDSYNKWRVATVVSHELAHQWFGNLVTMEWWNDIWLNEAFASYFEYLGVESFEPSWKAKKMFVVHDYHVAMNYYPRNPLAEHALSANGTITSNKNARALFTRITYQMGASILRMIHHYMGDNDFKAALRKYVVTHKYSTATAKDLITALDNQKPNVSKFVERWVYQVGYPLLTVKIDKSLPDNWKIKIRQERYAHKTGEARIKHLTSPFPPYNYSLWYYPLYLCRSTESPCLNLNQQPLASLPMVQAQQDVEVNVTMQPGSTWLKINSGQFVPARVLYEISEWQSLGDALYRNPDIMSDVDRAGLLMDALALSRDGHLDLIVALNFTRFLENDVDYLPWEAFDNFIDSTVGKFVRDVPGLDIHYQQYVQKLAKKAINQLGYFNDSPRHTFQQKMLQRTLHSMLYDVDDPDIINRCPQIFVGWVDNQMWIPPDFRKPVYKCGMRFGSMDPDKQMRYFDVGFKEYVNTTLNAEFSRWFPAFTESPNELVLGEYIRRLFDPENSELWNEVSTDKMNFARLGKSFAKVPSSLKTGYWFFFHLLSIRNTTKKMNTNFQPEDIDDIIRVFASEFSSRFYRREQFETLVAIMKGFGIRSVRMEEYDSADVDTRVQWLDDNEDRIKHWFQTYFDGSRSSGSQ